MKKFVLLLAVCALLPAGRAAAIELSLEENRAEAGTIGYVDMERVFKAHPETNRAKDEFVLLIKDKKDIVALKRNELAAIKARLARLKDNVCDISAREALAGPQLPAQQAAAIPAVSTVTAVAVSSSVAAAPLANAATAQAALPSAAPVLPSEKEILVNMQAAIAVLDKDVADREEELVNYKKRSEKELVELEGKRSEMILGKIYIVLRQLAAEENLSVVVDKKTILYGYTAVDLTDKLLERLK